MEEVGVNVVVDPSFWRGKRVLVTGHTGFKGSWLSLWLTSMGAQVSGYALNPPTDPAAFVLMGLDACMASYIGDIRNRAALAACFERAQPEIVLHLAAQPLVLLSYEQPIETYETNIMGTAYLLEQVRHCASVRAVVMITSDKCYENREQQGGYREGDPMGGFDPYSSSKGCAELIIASYRNSYFPAQTHQKHHVALASARAGNVIGGGDWALDRLVPDIFRSVSAGKNVVIRRPRSVRPWQHVLEPLGGYLLLAQRLYHHVDFAQAWNFGPAEQDACDVETLVRAVCMQWGKGASYTVESENFKHEAGYLRLNIEKSESQLGWRPVWRFEQTIINTVAWYQAYLEGADMRAFSLSQIDEYTKDQARLYGR